MIRVAANFIPWALTENQKELRVEACLALVQQLDTVPDFLSKVFEDL